MANPTAQGFSLSNELSPIILQGGIAQNITGGALPISTLLSMGGGTADGEPLTIDNALAVFMPLPGSSLINQQIGMYPFANQATAANAVITEPLGISFKMIAPSRQPGDYGGNVMAAISALQASLAQHNITGGTYICVTPSFIWSNCVMTGMRDISGGETKQVQYAWQLDFLQPLVTLAAAQAAQNNLMSQISGGTNIPGQPAFSGPSTSPASVQAPSVVPASQATVGAGIQGPSYIAGGDLGGGLAAAQPTAFQQP